MFRMVNYVPYVNIELIIATIQYYLKRKALFAFIITALCFDGESVSIINLIRLC